MYQPINWLHKSSIIQASKPFNKYSLFRYFWPNQINSLKLHVLPIHRQISFCLFDLLVSVTTLWSNHQIFVFKVQCPVTLLCPLTYMYPVSPTCCTNFYNNHKFHLIARPTLMAHKALNSNQMFQQTFTSVSIHFKAWFQCKFYLSLGPPNISMIK